MSSLKYLYKPHDIRALPNTEALKLGLMHDFTYNDVMCLAQEKFNSKCKLICTVEFKNNTTNAISICSLDNNLQFELDTVSSFNPSDQCYPITTAEWDIFLSDETEKLRTPMEIWVVDGRKYTAPI